METGWRFILNEGHQYYCVICGWDLKYYLDADYHSRSIEHTKCIAEYGDDLDQENPHKYYCLTCDCDVYGYTNVRSHLKGYQHQTNLYGPDYDDTDYDSDDTYYSDEDEYYGDDYYNDNEYYY